jgi:peptide-methionine (R)-S-oxide reductase
MMSRRNFLIASSALGVVAAFGGATAFAQQPFEVRHTTAEWRKILSEDAYMVMRQEQTEPPGYSPLDGEKREGVFSCAGCDLPVFASDKKYDSGTGWPSFWGPIDDKALGTRSQGSGRFLQVEVHCRRCGGHLGHIFQDGPEPTGLRYCINGVALKFTPA